MLVLSDTRLIFYYQNRLAAHGLGVDVIGKPTAGIGERKGTRELRPGA